MSLLRQLWRLVDNYKTYTVAITMLALGLGFLLTDPHATWDNPTGEVEAAARHVTAVVLLTQGAAIAALRHAIGKGASK